MIIFISIVAIAVLGLILFMSKKQPGTGLMTSTNKNPGHISEPKIDDQEII